MKETFIIRTEWSEAILDLEPLDQATIFQNLFHFHAGNENLINLSNLSVKLVWKLLLPNLKHNINQYDKRRVTSAENGKKGGRKPNLKKPNEPIESLSVTVPVIVPEPEIVTVPEIKNTNSTPPTSPESEKVKIQKEPSEEGMKYAQWYSDNHKPKSMEPTPKLLRGWANEYDRLTKLNYTKKQIADATAIGSTSPEWKSIMRSPLWLSKEIDGVRIIERIITNNPAQNSFEAKFEAFRKFYPGTKRGLATELKNFIKHPDHKEVIDILIPAIEKMMEWRKKAAAASQFVPQHANLQTWINQRRWEVEFETPTIAEPKPEKQAIVYNPNAPYYPAGNSGNG